MSEDLGQIISEHYQKTFELTYKIWEDRNKLFIYLVIVTGFGLLLILPVPETNSLLIDTIIKLFNITDKARIDQLQSNFPIHIVLTLVLFINFYLTQRLYSTNLTVSRGYQYLGSIEPEIKAKIGLDVGDVLFTREGKFYWGRQSIIQQISKFCYILIIILIHIPFMVLKIVADIKLKIWLLTAIDGLVIAITLVFLIGYIISTISLDNPETKKK